MEAEEPWGQVKAEDLDGDLASPQMTDHLSCIWASGPEKFLWATDNL